MSGEDVEKGNEDSIKVVARFRPLNDSEERAGSKFIVTFPHSKDDSQVSIGVSRGSARNPGCGGIFHPLFLCFLGWGGRGGGGRVEEYCLLLASAGVSVG